MDTMHYHLKSLHDLRSTIFCSAVEQLIWLRQSQVSRNTSIPPDFRNGKSKFVGQLFSLNEVRANVLIFFTSSLDITQVLPNQDRQWLKRPNGQRPRRFATHEPCGITALATSTLTSIGQGHRLADSTLLPEQITS